MKPFIAKDTREPLIVLGAYPIAHDGSIIHQPIKPRTGDYGADPIGPDENGVFRWKMVPSGDIVGMEERNQRLNN